MRRRVGAALGVAVGPMAGWAQHWSGAGDGRWYIWVLGSLLGALMGALAMPLFFEDDAACERGLTPVFGGLFGFTVGLLAGAIVAFPMGAVMASLVGIVAGGAGTALFRALKRRPEVPRLVATGATATVVGFLAAWWWTA